MPDAPRPTSDQDVPFWEAFNGAVWFLGKKETPEKLAETLNGFVARVTDLEAELLRNQLALAQTHEDQDLSMEYIEGLRAALATTRQALERWRDDPSGDERHIMDALAAATEEQT